MDHPLTKWEAKTVEILTARYDFRPMPNGIGAYLKDGSEGWHICLHSYYGMLDGRVGKTGKLPVFSHGMKRAFKVAAFPLYVGWDNHEAD